jgi:hypothetical protein
MYEEFVESALVLIRKMGANRFLRSEGAEHDA